MADEFCLKMPDFHVIFTDLLHAVNLRHEDKGLYFPSEGRCAEDFFALKKIRRLRAGLNPRTWVPKASTLPLDHRSRYNVAVILCVFWLKHWSNWIILRNLLWKIGNENAADTRKGRRRSLVKFLKGCMLTNLRKHALLASNFCRKRNSNMAATQIFFILTSGFILTTNELEELDTWQVRRRYICTYYVRTESLYKSLWKPSLCVNCYTYSVDHNTGLFLYIELRLYMYATSFGPFLGPHHAC